MSRARHAARPVVAALLATFAARAGASEPLAVRAEPGALLLGRDRSAALVVEVAAGLSGGAPPAFTASAGRVVDVRPTGPGRFAATYLPPAEGHPQVAVVAARIAGQVGWTALPLVGRGVAVARSRPGAAIRVTIGDASFGPVVAGPAGEARIPVVVPPGVRYALQGDQPLDLAVPETVHVHLAAERDDAPADAEREVRLWAFAVLPDGTPRRAAPVEIAPSHGWVTPPVEIAPGTFTATWRLPPGAAEPATAIARLRDEPVPAPALVLARPPGPPARVALEAARRQVVAGDTAPLPLRVWIEDAAGNSVDAVPRLEATRGTVSPATRAGPGTWEASWRAPPEVGGGGPAELVARAAGVEARLAVAIVAGDAARLVVEPAAPRVVADGRAEVAVRVLAVDRHGNPVPDAAPPVVTTDLPATVAAEPAADGAWLVRYRPARARADGVERLVVHAGAIEETARIAVVAPERRLAFAPTLGLVVSTAGARSAWVAAEGSYRLAPWAGAQGRAALAVGLGTFSHSRTDTVPLGGAAVEVAGDSRWTVLLASARWWQPLGARWAAWADAGLGAAHVGAEVRIGAAPAASEADVVPAARAALAAGVRLGHGTPFLEVGWMRFGSPDLERLRGSLSVVSVALGYRHDAY